MPVPTSQQRPALQASNWGELIGYMGSISLSVLRISLLLEREVGWCCALLC